MGCLKVTVFKRRPIFKGLIKQDGDCWFLVDYGDKMTVVGFLLTIIVTLRTNIIVRTYYRNMYNFNSSSLVKYHLHAIYICRLGLNLVDMLVAEWTILANIFLFNFVKYLLPV